MNSPRLLLLILCCVLAQSAAAQWLWTDKSGRKVFSDQPPSSDIPESAILRRPGGMRPLAAANAGGAANASAGDNAAPAGTPPAAPAGASPLAAGPKGKDPELEKRKAQAEAQAAAKKKEDEEKNAAARAENCARSQRGLASLQSGVRLVTSNAAGEREYMSDETRTAEVQRLQGIVNSDCR